MTGQITLKEQPHAGGEDATARPGGRRGNGTAERKKSNEKRRRDKGGERGGKSADPERVQRSDGLRADARRMCAALT